MTNEQISFDAVEDAICEAEWNAARQRLADVPLPVGAVDSFPDHSWDTWDDGIWRRLITWKTWGSLPGPYRVEVQGDQTENGEYTIHISVEASDCLTSSQARELADCVSAAVALMESIR